MPGTAHSECKGPGGGLCLLSPGSSEEASVAEAESHGQEMGSWGRDRQRVQVMWAWWEVCKDLVFYAEWDKSL